MNKMRGFVDWLQTRWITVYGLSAFLGIWSLGVRFLDWFGRADEVEPASRVMFGIARTLGLWVFPVAVVALLLLVNWDVLRRWWSGPAFKIRPIHGESLMHHLLNIPGEVTARLAIQNISGKPRPRCSVRIVEAYMIRFGHLMDAQGSHPSIHPARGESILLRWSPTNPDAVDGMFLDIPNDGVERLVDCLVVDQKHPGHAIFCAANPAARIGHCDRITSGGDTWWKLRVRVTSADGAAGEVELVAACADRDPGPITLAHWRPRGELILAEQRKEREEANAAAEAASAKQAEASAGESPPTV